MKTKARILVVDDNIELCEGIKEYLEREGYVTECAYNGKDAIALSQANKYDMALVDIQMSDIPGTELVKKLSRISPLTEFIHITAYASLDSAIEAVKHEKVVSYETKPIDMESLLSTIEQIVRRRAVEEELKMNNRQQEILNKLLKISLENVSLENLLEHALEVILSVPWMPTLSKGGIFLVEAEQDVLVLKVERGLTPELLEMCSHVPFGRCLCGMAALNSKIEYTGCIDERHENLYRGIVPHGHYNVPIISDGRVKGLLLLYLNEGHKRDEHEVMFLETVTNTLAGIIKRKQVELSLRDSEKKIRAWLEYSPVCTSIVDLDFNLQFMSSAGIKSLKIDDITQLYGKTYPFDFFPDLFRNSMRKNLKTVIETGEIITFEASLVNLDGNGLWYHSTLVPVNNDEGRINYIIIVSIDVSDSKRMEKTLLQSEKLKSIGIITAGISHEFNNILAVISGNVQLLERICKDDKKLIDKLRTIRRASKDGAEICNKMLRFTKMDEDTTSFVPYDIENLLNHAIDFTMPKCKNIAQAKGINFHINTEGMKSGYFVLCQPTEFREIFINIINNALDEMPDGGCISCSTWRTDKTIFVRISDNGRGMSDEVKKNIFDPFFTTKIATGTGLGLSMVYGIVTRHKGRIDVESSEGAGCTFTMQFPEADKVDLPKETSETDQKTSIKNLRIMVVDDNEDICNILDKFLSNNGHLVRTVNNGKDAIMLTKIDDYDLVLCDLDIPGVYGADVIKALDKLSKRPKVGIITGWDEKFSAKKKDELKVDFFIKKPFEFLDLTKKINSVLGDR